jgi:hypothetical protein
LFEALFVAHLARGIGGYHDPVQRDDLRLVAEVDRRCQRLGIDAATAREALEPFEIAGSSPKVSGWQLLRGSSEPRPMEPAVARHLILGEGPLP